MPKVPLTLREREENIFYTFAAYIERQCQRCDDASDTALIGNKGVTSKWIATPLFSIRVVPLAS